MNSNKTFFEAQQWAFSFIEKQGLETSAADMLLYGEMGFSATEFLMHLRQVMPQENWEHFQNNVKLYCQGWPAQYLLGSAYFYGLKLTVTPATLIPRPETEELVDWIISGNENTSKKVADIGTGTGAIGLALKSELSTWNVTLTDISKEALKVADKNASDLNLNVTLRQGDLLEPLNDGPYDIIISNPPYISQDEKKNMDRSVLLHEPQSALFAAENGLAFYRQIAEQIPQYIHTNSKLYLEIGYTQGKSVVALFKRAFPQAEVTLKRDITAHDRMVRVIFK
ncbi:MAG TPA: peptide chain release factor N(5)-glutamine methyltransferase [Candidatus Ligilactobacillus excrementavium]|nr:peptide chain release factor N(5)-glutamine methyltransferase [Candidatus Ligilactobacillus excrementavium]